MRFPIVLTENNVGFYLRIILKRNFGQKNAIVEKVAEIREYTNSTFIFRCHVAGSSYKILYLKQAREKTKNNFSVPSKRIFWEMKSARKFNEILGEDIAPTIFYFDKLNNIMVMQDVLSGGELFVDAFKRGVLRADLGNACGSIFGRLHGKTYGMQRHNFGHHNDWYKFLTQSVFLNFYLLGFQKFFGKKEVEHIMRESTYTTHSFCHMDPMIKNIILHRATIRIVDFEQATKWDPAYDVGSFLMPWAAALSMRQQRNAAENFMIHFFRSYKRKLFAESIDRNDVAEILRRALRFTATTILHNTWGSDPFDFLNPRRKELKENAVALLKGENTSFTSRIRNIYGIKAPLLPII